MMDGDSGLVGIDMKMPLMFRCLLVITFALLIADASALAGEGSWGDVMRGGGVVIDYQPQNTGGPASDTGFLNNFGQPSWQRLADDIVLSEAATIGHIRWWGFYNLDNPPATETFRIWVYESRETDGLPDESHVVFEQMMQDQVRTATGRRVFTGVDPDEYVFDALLQVPMSLPAGTNLWLEIIQVGDQSTAFRWENSIANLNGHAFNNAVTGDWVHTTVATSDTSYQLIVVPEPSTVLLGCMGAGAIWRRARREICTRGNES